MSFFYAKQQKTRITCILSFTRAYKNRAFNQTVKATKLQMKIQATKQEKSVNNILVYFRHLNINFNSYIGIKQPNMTDKDRFYKV